MGIFLDALKGQLTPQSMVGSGGVSKSSVILWLFLLRASMKKIQSKNEGARMFTTMGFQTVMGSLLRSKW